MNCSEVQNMLSAYLDKSIDPEAGKSINDHLSSCARCRTEVESFTRSIRLVATLPQVEPPPSLTARVMAHVREASHKPAFWERLFVPFRLKLPIHVTAVVLIGILAVYLYQKDGFRETKMDRAQPDFSFKPAESGKTAEPPIPPSVSPSEKPRVTDESEARVHSRQSKDPQLENESPLLTRPEQPRQPGPKEAPTSLQQRQLEEKTEAVIGSQPGRSASPLPAEPAGAVDQTAPGSGGSSRELRQRAAPATFEALKSARGPTAEHTADYDIVMRLRARAPEAKLSAGRLQSRHDVAEGEFSPPQERKSLDLARERALQTGQPQIVWLSIPNSQYEQFKKELASWGSIASESHTASADKEPKSTDQLRIKLTIVVGR